jgi:hypothetical protein
MDTIERLVRLLQTKNERDIAGIRSELNEIAANDSNYIYFPLSIADDREIPTGKQQVVSDLTVEATVTLTVNGTLQVSYALTLSGTMDGTGTVY